MSRVLLSKDLVNTSVKFIIARLAQSAEREAFNLVVVGSIPTVGAIIALSHFVKGWNLPFVLLGISD